VRAILRDCVSHILANQAVAQIETETGGVHQMRVGVRRLRSAMGIFDKFIASPESEWIVGELKWLASELGHARDWDVLVTHTLDLAEDATASRAAVEAVVEAANVQRRAAHLAVARAVTSPRYTTLMLTLGGWLAEDRWQERLDPEAAKCLGAPLRDVGRDLLGRLGRKVEKAGRNIENARPKDRHKLRKGLKKLRYGADFLACVYPRKRVKRHLGRLSDLQDVLGALNDLAVAETLLKELAMRRGRLRKSTNRLCREFAALAHRQTADLAGEWRRYRKLEPFWV
jgi:triphosphatase